MSALWEECASDSYLFCGYYLLIRFVILAPVRQQIIVGCSCFVKTCLVFVAANLKLLLFPATTGLVLLFTNEYSYPNLQDKMYGRSA